MDTVTSQNQKGFTLVEIAIVLVIIGLLLGGVLKGQELITNSKIKAVTGDFEGISTAYYAYQDRTGVVPGDTDSDGLIDDSQNFWDDLRSEGFISGASGASAPSHDLDGSFSVGSGGMFTGPSKNYTCVSNIKSSVAQGMDVKLDDGNPQTGIVRSGDTATTSLSTAYTNAAATFVCREL